MKTKGKYIFLAYFSFFALLLICIPSPSSGQAAWSGIIQVAGLGSDAQGAGIAFVNLDSNPSPEIVLMAYDKPASGAKTFRYKIGWNVGTNGVASSWSPVYQVLGSSLEAQGAGIGFVNLDSNPSPEMVLMAYNTSKAKVFDCMLGLNVNTSGVASIWGPALGGSGVGSDAQGAGIAFANLDSNPNPEMVLMAYDNTSGVKTFRYIIGWNVIFSGFTMPGSTQLPGQAK